MLIRSTDIVARPTLSDTERAKIRRRTIEAIRLYAGVHLDNLLAQERGDLRPIERNTKAFRAHVAAMIAEAARLGEIPEALVRLNAYLLTGSPDPNEWSDEDDRMARAARFYVENGKRNRLNGKMARLVGLDESAIRKWKKGPNWARAVVEAEAELPAIAENAD